MLNVMVVDDSLIIRRNIKKMLTELGCNVVAEAVNGQEAVKLYAKHNPDAVTMDITMPIKTGIEALKEIRKECKDAVIIMVTSHGQEELVMDAIKSGAKGYLLKPVTIDKLTTVFKKAFPELTFEAKKELTAV